MVKKHLIILIVLLVTIAFVFLFYYRDKTATQKTDAEGSVYYNLLHEISFELPNDYKPEDVTFSSGVALYKDLSEQFQKTKTESDFLKSGGIYIKALRPIPGTKETFDTFRKQDFEVKLKQLNKTFTSEPLVTNQGYDAFRIVVTSPTNEVHVVVNCATAFWFEAESDTADFKTVYQTFKPFEENGTIIAKQSRSVAEGFINDLQNARYEQAQNKMSATLKNKFTKENLESNFGPATDRLNRQLRVFSVQVSGNKAFVRATMENTKTSQYTFVKTNLISETNEWRVDQFVFDQDKQGLPYEIAIKNVKKEVKKEDLLKGNQ